RRLWKGAPQQRKRRLSVAAPRVEIAGQHRRNLGRADQRVDKRRGLSTSRGKRTAVTERERRVEVHVRQPEPPCPTVRHVSVDHRAHPRTPLMLERQLDNNGIVE